MGLSSEQCAALCRRAAEKGVAVGVNHNFLFSHGYEALRAAVKGGELGRIDDIAVNWHYALPILQFGPFDNWMLAAPANIVFEIGSHVCSLAADLIGAPVIGAAIAANPISLPAGQSVFRQWTAVGRTESTTALLSISLALGHADRILRIRGRGGSAQLDFGRDILIRESTVTDNPIFDSFHTAAKAGRDLRRQAIRDRLRRLRSALTKRPDANPFEESIYRSIKAFYEGGVLRIDPRHDGRFGTEVIRLCEAIASAAGMGAPSERRRISPCSEFGGQAHGAGRGRQRFHWQTAGQKTGGRGSKRSRSNPKSAGGCD